MDPVDETWFDRATRPLRRLGEELSGTSPVLRPAHPAVLGLVWAALALLVYAFGGHDSKFVYVDF